VIELALDDYDDCDLLDVHAYRQAFSAKPSKSARQCGEKARTMTAMI